MQVKTNELTEAALDWAVAKCLGYIDDCNTWMHLASVQDIAEGSFHPSTDWAEAGPIIEREKITLQPVVYPTGWMCSANRSDAMCEGLTPLSAAMRCYVTSKLGNTVDIPNELV